MKTVSLVLLFASLGLAQPGNPNGGGGASAAVILQPRGYLVGTLPTGVPTNRVVLVTDGVSTADCGTGGGSSSSWCRWTGAAWVPVGGSSLTPSFTSLSIGSVGTDGCLYLAGTDGVTEWSVCSADSGTYGILGAPLSLGTGYISEPWTAGAGGVTAGQLVSFNTVPRVVNTATSGTDAIGIAVTTAASTVATTVAVRGRIGCLADNATTAGNLAIVGTSTAGACRDAGTTTASAVPVGSQIIGRMLTSVSGGATVSVELLGPGLFGNAGNSGVFWTAGTATLAQVNAGLTILTGVTGRTVRVVGVFFKVTGANWATCTDVRLSDTNGTPVDVVTIGVAGLTTGNRLGDFSSTNVTWGSFLAALTSGAGLQLRQTGSACATGVSFDYRVFYAYN